MEKKKKKNYNKSRNRRPWYPRMTLKINIHIFGLTKCTIYCKKCSCFSLCYVDQSSPGTPAFLSPQKPRFPNSNSPRNQVDEEPLNGCAYLQIVIYLFIYLFTLLIFRLKELFQVKNGLTTSLLLLVFLFFRKRTPKI